MTLAPVPQDELAAFKAELLEAFTKGLQDRFTDAEDPAEMGPIPSEEDFNHSLTAKESVVRQLLLNAERIEGLGTKMWEAIEAAFPETKVWELHTPYFEKRNIHFYVNKCGFKIVEFYHQGNPGPNVEGKEPESDEEYEFFRFEKVMTKVSSES